MSFVRSGAVTTAGREASFLKDQYYHTLEGLSYTDLESLKYQLYLDEVKRLGSIKKFKETYPGMEIPKPPVQIAGGPVPLPGSTPIPTIVPISRVPIHSSEEERKEEREDIMRMRNNQIGQAASNLPVSTPISTGDNRTETRGRPTPQGSVYVETLRQLMNKLITDKRSNILQTTLNANGFAQGFVSNRTLQDALKKIFKDNGYDLSGKAGKDTANRALEEILNSDLKSQQLLMNELAERLMQEEIFRGKFTVRDMTEDAPPEVLEPNKEKQEEIKKEVIEKLKTVMKPEDAEKLYDILKEKERAIRLDYFSKSGDFGFADDKTNESILKIVKEEINRIKSPSINTNKIFKILRDNMTVLNLIPDSVVDRFPTLRFPTSSTQKKDRKTEEEARKIIRDAGIELEPSGQFAGYGSYSITTSEALSRRLQEEGYDFTEPNRDDYEPIDEKEDNDPNPGDYPYPGRETIEIRDTSGRVRTVSGSYKMIIAILTALGALVGGTGIAAGKILRKDEEDDKVDESSDLPPDEGGDEGSDDDKSLDTIKAEIRILKDKIEKAQNMGASQNVIDELTRQLNAKEKIYFIKYGDIAGQSQELIEARYNASTAFKKIQEYNDIIANADPQDKVFLDRMKYEREGVKTDYDRFVSEVRRLTADDSTDIIPDMPNPPETDDGGDDPDSEITPPQNIPIEPTDTSEGVMIAQYIDPAEAKLFLSNDKESRNEQKRWEEFSRVQPGHSLGNARTNPLIAVNQEYYRKQFQNCDQTRKLVQPSIWKKPRGTIYNQPQLIDIYDGNARGKIHFEEDDWHTNRFMSSKLYNPFRTSVSNYNWNNANMNWHPEHHLSRYNFKPTTIPEVRTQPGYYSVDSRPSINNNPLIAPKQTGVKDAETLRNDNFQTKKPKKVYSNLSHFKQNVRIKSTRNR